MRSLLLSLVLVVGCAPAAQAEEPKTQVQHYQAKVHDVEVAPGLFVTPMDFPCGNGNTMCTDGQLCFNGDCLTFCGSHECFVEIETAFDNSGICPSQDPAPPESLTSAERFRRMKRNQHR